MLDKKVKKKFQQLKKLSDEEIDLKVNSAHHEVFDSTNCLDCGNCCKKIGPRMSKKDINRISKHINQSPTEFTTNFLELNEDHNYVLKTLPCLFLEEDNKCSIYEIRPEACASFPYTETRNMRNHFPYLMEHKDTCPAIEEIIEKL